MICEHLLADGHAKSTAALATTSRRLSEITNTLLYGSITIDGGSNVDERIERLLRTYEQCPERISLLRHIKLGIGQPTIDDCDDRSASCVLLLLSRLDVPVAPVCASGSIVPSVPRSCFSSVTSLDLHGPLMTDDILSIVNSSNLRKLTLRCLDAITMPGSQLGPRKPTATALPLELHFLEQCALGAPVLQEIMNIRPRISRLVVYYTETTTWYGTPRGVWTQLTPSALQACLEPLRQTLEYLKVTDDSSSEYHGRDIGQYIVRLNDFTSLKPTSLPSTLITSKTGRHTRLRYVQQVLPPSLEHLKIQVPPHRHWTRLDGTAPRAPNCRGLPDLVELKPSMFPRLTSISIQERSHRRWNGKEMVPLPSLVIDLPDDVAAAARKASVKVSISLRNAEHPLDPDE